jgi:hypothetical protein
MLGRPRSPITVANEQVSILYACRLIGMDVPETLDGRPPKVHCPFGPIYHRDQGAEAAMRIYPDDNHVYCFAGCGYFTPVSLVAHAWDTDRTSAAVDLLERAGIKPLTLAQAWAQASTTERLPDIALLAEALKTFCARIDPTWSTRQFTPVISAPLRRCLLLLDHVHTEEQAHQWLDVCKLVMRRVLSA